MGKNYKFRKFKSKLLYSLRLRKGVENTVRAFLDPDFYLTTYPDVNNSGMDPVAHYLRYGWQEGRNPSANFNTTAYLANNHQILENGINPYYHHLISGKKDIPLSGVVTSGFTNKPADIYHHRIPHILQNSTFPTQAETAEALFIVVIPEHNTMSGGIYSFFSIAKAVYNMRHKHHYEVLLMTRPNPMDATYLRQSNFRNSEDVFRFEQIARCTKAKEIHLNIPEYAASTFISHLKAETLDYLRSREKLHINILNQNIELMPEKEEFEDLRSLATTLTQSVAHHSYSGQRFSDRYDLPTLLLPAYTDLSGYEPIPYDEKEKLIIYSPDDAPHRKPVLERLLAELPDYRLQEIRGITFDRFMELATRCRYSITFGEGFDGYIAQPIYQNGIGFAVYNEEFFPSADLKNFSNIFSSEEQMIAEIVDRIRRYDKDPSIYKETNRSLIAVYESLYSKDDYLKRVEMLINRDFETLPSTQIRNVFAQRL